MCMPCRNGIEGWGLYPSVSGVLLLPLSLAVRVCSVCKGEGGETNHDHFILNKNIAIANRSCVSYALNTSAHLGLITP